MAGCAQKKVIANTYGKLTVSIKMQNLPEGENILDISLKGPDSAPITASMNNLSVKNPELSIPQINAGKWQCKVTVKNKSGKILFAGNKELSIIGNTTLKTYLSLFPDSNKNGVIFFFITYGIDFPEGNPRVKNDNYDTSGVWIDYNKNPILIVYNHPSYPFGLRAPKVIYDNGIFKMWYFCLYSSGIANVWYAESPDGLAWKTIGSSPVLTRGEPGSWDDYSICVSAVIKENNIYKMYYLGYHKGNNLVSLYVNDVWHTGVAESMDGIHWKKAANPIIYGTGYENMNITDIVKKDNIYYAYFGYSLTQATNNNSRIGVATSSDGINWEMHKIMSPTFQWEGSSVTSSTVILDDGIFKMIYVNSGGNAFGYATSTDGINFVKKDKPIFTSSNPIQNNNSLMSPNFRKINDTYWLYYCISTLSGDMELCVASSSQQRFNHYIGR